MELSIERREFNAKNVHLLWAGSQLFRHSEAVTQVAGNVEVRGETQQYLGASHRLQD
jgi:hypothetical protein